MAIKKLGKRPIRGLLAFFLFLFLFGITVGFLKEKARDNLEGKAPKNTRLIIRGWNILSANPKGGLKVIHAAGDYNVNHLQLSHQIIHNLREVKDSTRRKLCRKFAKAAHEAGIKEVFLWDHSLYDLAYYPNKFKTGPKRETNLLPDEIASPRTLDLDNPEFWDWFKQDYREMLDLVPEINL